MTTRFGRVALLLSLVFAALSLVALLGVIRNAIDASWRAPVPMAIMAAVGIALTVVAAGWIGIARDARGAGVVVASGNLLGIAIGLYGLWGLTVLTEPCLAGSSASLAASWPAGICDSLAPSFLIGGYLVSIGAVSVLSLVALWRTT